MENTRADLHIHTYYSDGLFSPDEVVYNALKSRLGIVSVTDHDCSLAYDELEKLCASAGIKAVRGIEVSAYSGVTKIHILGYAFDAEKPEFKKFYKELYDGSLVRAEDIVGKLRKNSVNITVEEILGYRKSVHSPVHSMHIARACALKGYCGGNYERFYLNYLAPGKSAFSNLCRPTPEHTVEVIASCGGFASLAHPARLDLPKEGFLKLVGTLKERGLGGIEAVYSAHTSDETAYYKETARKFALAVTGGSDTHYDGGKRRIGSPEFYVDEVLAKKLKIEKI